ncbi:hypothetical protein Rsub_10019 [Raphidocelis subcapitata]|uniref:Uncharacterized protein n=1 Tax=Raphidocelis subcapitata TaxID=307507 RepID=A0A2V0PBU4_9CHLO|nr:hypothetical protein Rsub_10019 [Raphidocelis subcapitata]|eukprot:GBF97328.1 hypothetical protein Rsub_10019 [Raphidocelis subcapitata]
MKHAILISLVLLAAAARASAQGGGYGSSSPGVYGVYGEPSFVPGAYGTAADDDDSTAVDLIVPAPQSSASTAPSDFALPTGVGRLAQAPAPAAGANLTARLSVTPGASQSAAGGRRGAAAAVGAALLLAAAALAA